MGRTFSALSRFWIILQGINSIYTWKNSAPVTQDVSLAMVESYYHQLLAWADTLHPDMYRGKSHRAHVLFLQYVTMPPNETVD